LYVIDNYVANITKSFKQSNKIVEIIKKNNI